MITSLSIALSVGVLFAAGSYLFMQRNALRVIVGLLLISNGANLAILAMSREPADRRAPIIAKEEMKQGHEAILLQPFADPLPQALILTAIVIGFGVMAFMIALVYAGYAEEGTVLLGDLDEDPTGDRRHRRQDSPPAATAGIAPAVAAPSPDPALAIAGGESMSDPPPKPNPAASAVSAPPLPPPAASKPQPTRSRPARRRRK